MKCFTLDMAGLKAIHKVLFSQIYEWAGQTRDETVTTEGERFTPPDHVISRGDVHFGCASWSASRLSGQLARQRTVLDEAQKSGTLTKER